ncbi:hypothetical protein MD484_g8491, partial [Candolleomyces efflorescens]
MGKRWADNPQWEWMQGMLPEYREAVARGTKKEFFAATTRELIKKFGIAPSEEAVQVLGREAATQALWDLYSARVENWFPNATRASTAADPEAKRATLEPKKKVLQHWQVYQKLYWDQGLKERVDKECQRIHGAPLAGLDHQKRFAVRNRLILELYKKETAEVRRIVDDEREGRRQQPLSDQEISQNLSKLPRTLKQFGENVASKTEWTGVLCFGGPHPSFDRRIYTNVRCVGTTPDGRSFDDFLGKEAYREWLGKLDSFFEACSGVVPTPLVEPAHSMAASSSSGEAAPTPASKEAETPRKAPARSDYETTRAINMARNKVVLGVIDKTVDSKDVTEALVDALKHAEVELDEKDLNEVLKQIRSICPSLSTNSSTSVPISSNSSEGSDVSFASVGDVPATPQPVPSSPTVVDHVSADPVNSNNATVVIEREAVVVVEGNTAVPVDSKSTDNTAKAVAVGEGNTAVPVDSKSTDDTATPSLNTAGAIHPGTVTTDSPPSIPVGVTDITLVATAATNQAASIGNTDGHKPEQVHAAATLSLATENTTTPAFLKATWKYLLGILDTVAWRGLLARFADFELRELGIGRMNTTSRPKAVQTWIRSHKKTLIPDIDLAVYPTQTLAWWKSNQPSWRIEGVDGMNPLGFKRTAAPDADWTTLSRGGTAGIYTVVMALSWWISRAGSEWSEELAAFVDDLAWVLGEMSRPDPKEALSTQTAKRAHDDEPSDNPERQASSGRHVKRARHCEA